MTGAMSLSATVSRHHGLAVAKAARFKLKQAAPVATVAELANYDAIAVGAPTRFGRLAPTSRLTPVKLHGGMIGVGATLAWRPFVMSGRRPFVKDRFEDCCERLGRGHVYGLLMRKGWLRWP